MQALQLQYTRTLQIPKIFRILRILTKYNQATIALWTWHGKYLKSCLDNVVATIQTFRAMDLFCIQRGQFLLQRKCRMVSI